MNRSDAFRGAAKEIRRVAPTQGDDVRKVMLETADKLDVTAATIDAWAALGETVSSFKFSGGRQ